MNAIGLVCRKCKLKIDLGNDYHCKTCDGILDVKYDYAKMCLERDNILDSFDSRAFGVWRYREFLPINSSKNIVSIGEGGTPLLESIKISANSNVRKAYYKLESCNPTGSFKDRPTSVAVSKAVEFGSRSVIIASSGNAGASASAYAARAGIDCIVCIPESTPSGKVAQAISHGANVVLVRGSYSNSYNIALQASEKYNLINLTSTFLNPYTVEGDKTLAYELWEQMGGLLPDWIIVPIGAGPLLVGIYKAFCELKVFGLIDKIPRMIGVQTEVCSPIVDAFEQQKDVKAWAKPIKSIASGITDPLVGYPDDGTLTNLIIRESKGLAVKVKEDDIINSAKWLAVNEGVFAEPTAAASLAAFRQLDLQHLLNGIVVMVITGHGLKTANALLPKEYKAPIIDSIDELKSIIDSLHKT